MPMSSFLALPGQTQVATDPWCTPRLRVLKHSNNLQRHLVSCATKWGHLKGLSFEGPKSDLVCQAGTQRVIRHGRIVNSTQGPPKQHYDNIVKHLFNAQGEWRAIPGLDLGRLTSLQAKQHGRRNNMDQAHSLRVYRRFFSR